MIEVDLPFEAPPVLAVGAFLKNCVGAAKGGRAVVTKSGNDLQTPADVKKFKEDLKAMQAWLGAPAKWVAHDLHPDFPNTRHAQSLGLPCLPVQHHHAHVAAVLAEHGETALAAGLALDGFGLGPGNQSWGGELLLVDGPRYERLGHLSLLAQPGGDAAARQPWRMAAAALHELGKTGVIAQRFQDQPGAEIIGQMLARGVNAPYTSSAGRLFDAACGLLNLMPVAEFEGQAPMALERLVDQPMAWAEGFRIDGDVLSFLPLLARLDGMAAKDGANLFHGTLALGLARFAGQAARNRHIGVIVLSGGCFLNKVLSKEVHAHLTKDGFRVLMAEKLSPGDGGLALGQAWVAALTKD